MDRDRLDLLGDSAIHHRQALRHTRLIRYMANASTSVPAVSNHYASRSNASTSSAAKPKRPRSSARVNGSAAPHAEPNRGWSGELLSRSAVLDRLREHATQHGVVTSTWLSRNDPLAYHGALAHFGGIAAARRAAKVSDPGRGRQWSEARVINELRQLKRRRRIRFTAEGLRAAGHQALVSAIRTYVGTLARARRLARIPDPEALRFSPREHWDDRRVIGEIRKRHRRGEPLSSRKVPHSLLIAAVRYCGGWRQAIEMAGLSYDQIRMRRAWTRKDLLEVVKRAAAQRMKDPGGPTMHQLISPAEVTAIGRFFGGLPKALRAAGIDRSTVMTRVWFGRRSKATIVAELRTLVGQRPGITSRELFETRLGAEAAARLGGQIAAIDAIGELWTGRRSLPMASADEVIAGLRTRHRQGCAMTMQATERRLVHAATKHFGTWRAAMEAAGLSHLVGRRTPKAVLAKQRPTGRRDRHDQPRSE